MNINEPAARARQEEFIKQLTDLIEKYPEVITPDDDSLEEMCGHYNPNDPKIIKGLILIVCTETVNHFEELYWTRLPDQSYYLTSGMLNSIYSRLHG